MITGQVIDHLARAKLVIADLSFGNPNVYYELALRHATRKPIVQIIRTSDLLPFDVGWFRTVTIDMTDIYTLVPQLDLHRQEITRQCRAALSEGAISESPLSRFYPQFWDEIGLGAALDPIVVFGDDALAWVTTSAKPFLNQGPDEGAYDFFVACQSLDRRAVGRGRPRRGRAQAGRGRARRPARLP